jgi:hypothetical protein
MENVKEVICPACNNAMYVNEAGHFYICIPKNELDNGRYKHEVIYFDSLTDKWVVHQDIFGTKLDGATDVLVMVKLIHCPLCSKIMGSIAQTTWYICRNSIHDALYYSSSPPIAYLYKDEFFTKEQFDKYIKLKAFW